MSPVLRTTVWNLVIFFCDTALTRLAKFQSQMTFTSPQLWGGFGKCNHLKMPENSRAGIKNICKDLMLNDLFWLAGASPIKSSDNSNTYYVHKNPFRSCILALNPSQNLIWLEDQKAWKRHRSGVQWRVHVVPACHSKHLLPASWCQKPWAKPSICDPAQNGQSCFGNMETDLLNNRQVGLMSWLISVRSLNRLSSNQQML